MKNYINLRIAITLIIIFILSTLNGCEVVDNIPKLSAATAMSPAEIDVFSAETPQTVISPPQITKETTTDNVDQKINTLTRYDFHLVVDYEAHLVQVEESISYQNYTGNELDQVPLIVPPGHFTGAMTLDSITTDTHNIENVEFSDNLWKINLSSPLATGASIILDIKYSINIPRLEGAFGYTSLQTNLYAWYPFIPPYIQHQGWMIHDYSPIGEYVINEKSDFYATIKFRDDSKVVVACTGEEITEGNILGYKNLNARDLSLSMSPFYKTISQEIGETTINLYLLQDNEIAGKELLRNTSAAMVYFGSLYDNPYPKATLNVVEADFPDGMEADGMYFISKDYIQAYDGTHRNYLTIISAHETAHQWFYGMVGNDQALHPWLDEALCTYSEVMFFETFYPSDVDWWWSYRVNQYNPTGNVDRSIYDFTSLRGYINAIYLRGTLFLQELRSETGEEFFITTLRQYILTFKDKIAPPDGFFSQFGEINLTNLKQKYFSE